MILTVTLNAAIDKRYVVKRNVLGEVNRVLRCAAFPGGKGLNVAKPIAIYGSKVIATGFVGGYAGEFIENSLDSFQVDGEFYHVKGESRTCINIWDEERHIQTEYLEPGFEIMREDWQGFLKKFTDLVKKVNVVTISGSIPRGLDIVAYPELVSIVKKYDKPVILDTSGDLLKEGIKACPTLIKPNIDEIRFLTGKKCDDLEEIIQAAKEIQRTGVKYVIVSLGGKGSLMVSSEGTYRAIVPYIDAVNTVGCGDSMIAGFAIGLEEKLSPKEMLRKGSAISAASAMREETGMFFATDMEKLISEIEIKELN